MLKGSIVTFTDLDNVMTQLTIPNVNNSYNKIISKGAYFDYKIHKPIFETLDWIEISDKIDKHKQIQTENPHLNETLNEINDSILIEKTYDIILLTDCIFSIDMSDKLVNIINYYSNNKTIIMCCYEIRDEVSLFVCSYRHSNIIYLINGLIVLCLCLDG